MATDTEKQAAMNGLSGAASGAAMGFAFGGAIGAVIGGVVGGVAGVVTGSFQGRAKKKANRYAKKAAEVQIQREENKDYANFLQAIRQQRIARATTLAEAVSTNTERSSMTAGAVSGQQSQTGYTLNYLANDRRLKNLYLSYMRMAGKATSIEQDLDAFWGLNLSIANDVTRVASAYKGAGTGVNTTDPRSPQADPQYRPDLGTLY